MPENTENQVNTGQYDDTINLHRPFNCHIPLLHSNE